MPDRQPSVSQLQTFTRPARVQMVQWLQIVDGECQEPDPDNPVVCASATQAYAMAVAFVHRPLIRGDYIDRFQGCGERELLLRVTPVHQVQTVWINDVVQTETTDLNDPQDYRVVGDRIVFTRGFERDFNRLFLTGDEYNGNVEVTVQYLGGFDRADSDAQLLGALAEQIGANYRRAPFVGLRQSSAGHDTGTVAVGSDAGGLIEGVKTQLDPLVYLGTAEGLRVAS